MANDLPVGRRRHGDLVDFDPETPEVKVTLEHSEDGISVTVPWSGPGSPYASWFLGGEEWFRTVTDRSASMRSQVPKRLLFQDSHGNVLLVGCWARGFHTNIDGPGTGTVWASAAVLGVTDDVDFDRPHGLSSEISGLREWLGVSSWTEQYERVPGAPVTIRSTPPEAVEIGTFSDVTLTLRPSWQIRHEDANDRRVLDDLVRCSTRSEEPRSWDEHLQLHHAVRDLLVLSRWRRESCVEVLANRHDDPLRTMDGAAHGSQWRSLVVPDDAREAPPSGHRPHLIKYADLGPDGVKRWIALREEFARALDPVISSIALRQATPHTLLAHTGPGLEALGYLLMVRDGRPAKKAAATRLCERLERIVEDVDECLPFDGAAWITGATATYNALKHANRAAPDEVDVVNAWRESLLAVRAWVALELGVPMQAAKDRMQIDPQRHPYVLRSVGERES